MATKYSKAAQTGQMGVDFVGSVATAAGAIYRRYESIDVGIDGAIEFVNEQGEPTGDMVLVQVKSGSSYVTGGRFTLSGDRDHFETWSRYGVPVVGIVHDPASGEGRWVDISAHLQQHPERITLGPYPIEAPVTQPFSLAGFARFASHFSPKRVAGTNVDATPNFFIREWQPADAKPTRALLAPIAADYPGFYGWLDRQWAKPGISKKVVEVNGAIAAYSMWVSKDDRNVKLQTFIVGQLFRGTSIGPHLLYHELRTWATSPRIERVFVTVASSKSDLIGYFRQFGFRVEGISANRYPRTSGAAELVMVKHFIRDVVRSPKELTRVTDMIAQRIWGLNLSGSADTRFRVAAENCAVPTSFSEVTMTVDRAQTTVAPRVQLVSDGGAVVRREDDASLMREFYPLRLHLRDKRYLIVPIYAQWVTAMLSVETSTPTTTPTNLKLRIDNVYYCYPKFSNLRAGDHVLFYEPAKNDGSKSVIGSAIVRRATYDTPENLFAELGDRGVYTVDQIRRHAHGGVVMAIHFELFEPFSTRVALSEIRQVLQNRTNMQGLTKITRDQFEFLRQRGLP